MEYPREIKDNKKGTGNNSVQNKNELQKDGFHSGGPTILPSRHAFFKSLHRFNVKICKGTHHLWVGSGKADPPPKKGSGSGQRLVAKLERKIFSRKNPRKTITLRLLGMGLGGLDINTGQQVQEFWRDQGGLHINVKELTAAISTQKKLRKTTRKNLHFSGQHSCLHIFKKGGTPSVQLHHERFLAIGNENNIQIKVNLVKSADD